MSEDKVLPEKELEEVSGGSPYSIGELKVTYSGFVDKYSGVVGQDYYVVNNNTQSWFYGTLVESCEKKHILWTTKRYHTFRFKFDNMGEGTGQIMEVCGDDHSMYKTRTVSYV